MNERVEHDSRSHRALADAKAIGSHNGFSSTFQSCVPEQCKLPTCSKSQCASCNTDACNSNNRLLSSTGPYDANRLCLGVPHCLHYPIAQAAPAPAILEGIQMKQAQTSFYSKLPQLQFLTRFFHNNIWSKSICSETLHGHRGVPCEFHSLKDAQHQAAETRSSVLLDDAQGGRIPVTLLPSSTRPCSSKFSGILQMPAHNAQGNTRFMSQKLSFPGIVEQSRSSSSGLDLDKKTSMMQAILFGREDLLGVVRPTSGAETGARSGSCLLCHPIAMMTPPSSSQPVVAIPVQLQLPSSSSQWSQGSQEEGQGPSNEPQIIHPCSRWPSNLRTHGVFTSQACMQGQQSAAPPLVEASSQEGTIHVASVGSPGLQGIRSHRNCVKGQWSLAEDKALVKLVKQYGTRRWSLISTFMASEFIANCFFWVYIQDRSGKQCRERWVNHLQPDIRKEGWTKEEEELLVQAHSYFGNKWSAIAKMLPGRTDNSIKNHWHAALRKKDRHGKLRSNLLREYIQQKLAKNGQEETQTTTNMVQG